MPSAAKPASPSATPRPALIRLLREASSLATALDCGGRERDARATTALADQLRRAFTRLEGEIQHYLSAG